MSYINKYLSAYLCGYWEGNNTQQTLISIIEKSRKTIDKKGTQVQF